MDEQELIDALVERGFGERGAAARAARAAISALHDFLPRHESQGLALLVPGELASPARRPRHARSVRRARSVEDAKRGYAAVEELYERVGRTEGVSPSVGREHVQMVLGILAERLEPEQSARLARALPAELAFHLRPRDVGEPPEHVRPSRAPPLTTLASGRPGSRHPLSEASPVGGQAHSVASEPNPHGESKLSSARGLTQERLGDAIATGHPGPERPLSEAHEQALERREPAPERSEEDVP